ncbi:class I SAM-dependent methyltransferase [Marilutibacter aestuarii]|nr:class I SAM-dependent methyltransferase [Lysobacter aestuarii]
MEACRGTVLHPQWLLRGSHGVEDLVRCLPKGRVLDVGCADRWIAKQLPMECDYLGMDYPATGRDMYGARPDFFADAARIPLPDASMEAVLMLEVVEHLRYPREALAECARILVPGGILLASMPFLYPMHDEPHDYQRYTLHGWRREVEAVGLELNQIHPTLKAIETAGLLACLALAGGLQDSLRGGRSVRAMALLPVVGLVVPSINVITWLVAKLWPSWPAAPSGYVLSATKK